MSFTFRTLCSGGELFGVGAAAAGWQHVDGYELRPDIAAVAQQNGFDVRVADICAVDYSSLVPVDHLHASPSCKTASTANTGATETPEDLEVSTDGRSGQCTYDEDGDGRQPFTTAATARCEAWCPRIPEGAEVGHA
jgi:site-specific DNA-cytosine methylase